MPSAHSIYQPQGWSQRNQRREQTFTDQFGRKYHGTIETKTGDVVGLIQALYEAPLIPQQKYLERVPERPYDLYWNLKRYKADVRGARREWEREGRQLMRKMRGKGYDPAEEFGEDVLDIIGEPPEAIEPIIAAEQRNSWILGFTKKVDVRLAHFFEREQLDPDYVAETDPDFRDEKVERAERHEVRGRVPVKSSRPQPRQVTKGEGRRKGHPPRQPGADRPRREQYPKGHPKAGQFVPLWDTTEQIA